MDTTLQQILSMCSVDRCGAKARAKGLCQRHYDQQRALSKRAAGTSTGGTPTLPVIGSARWSPGDHIRCMSGDAYRDLLQHGKDSTLLPRRCREGHPS